MTVTTIDWLEMKLVSIENYVKNRADRIVLSQNLSLQRIPKGYDLTQTPEDYLKHFELEFQGQKYGVVNVGPSKTYGQNNLCRCRIDNAVFPTEQLGMILSELFDGGNFIFKNFTRLDFAVDTNEDLITKTMNFYDGVGDQIKNQFVKPKYKLCCGTSLSQKKEGGVCYYTINKLITVYDKTLELKNNKAKAKYQNKYFKNNGLDITCINRLEVRLTNERIRLMRLNINPRRLCDAKYLASIVDNVISKKGLFRELSNPHASRNPKHRLIELLNSDSEPLLLKTYEPEDKISGYMQYALKLLIWLMKIIGDVRLSEAVDMLLLNSSSTFREWYGNYSGRTMQESELRFEHQLKIK